MKTLSTMIIVVLACGPASPALADWQVGDEAKMERPQLPDPNGWDIDMTEYTLADDWRCSETGVVTDIHFWYSVKGDKDEISTPHIRQIRVSIHDNIPVGPGNFSIPGPLLWEHTFDETEFRIAGPWGGIQGWDRPEPDTNCEPDDHTRYWQVNIEDIAPDPNHGLFRQEIGNIYWLDLSVVPAASGTDPLEIGWKTTEEINYDSAVYLDANGIWQMIAVCTDDHETDLAFVIVPEPITMGLLAAGALAMLRRRRKS